MSETNPTPAATPAAPVAPETFSREYVEGLRQEAARYRTEKNEAVTAATAAVNQDWATKVTDIEAKLSALEADLGDAWVYAAKVEAAVAAGVPTDKLLGFVQILKGSDAASIKASVESAKALFGFNSQLATDPTQGSGGVPPLALNGDELLATVNRALGI